MRGEGMSMGLFNWGKNKDADNAGKLAEYSGIRVEVMDTNERLLFIAHVSVTWEGKVELRPTTALRVPASVKDFPVLMRGFQTTQKKAVHMEARISPRSDGSWTVEDLKITGKDNDRAFFRQDTLLSASVMPLHQRGVSALPCKVVNVSAGGACIQFAAECMLGERLMLNINLTEDAAPMQLMCVVRRVIRRKTTFEYGCEFVDLPPAVEEAVSKAILDMQLQRMHSG